MSKLVDFDFVEWKEFLPGMFYRRDNPEDICFLCEEEEKKEEKKEETKGRAKIINRGKENRLEIIIFPVFRDQEEQRTHMGDHPKITSKL